MGLFGDIKNWIVNAWTVSNRFDPYFNNFNRDLSYLKIIKEDIDPEITKIYNQIKTTAPQKYAKQIAQYEGAIAKIREHNNKVNKINEGMTGFDYDKIIDNPHNFDYSSISKFAEIANLIKTFPKYGSPYDEFVEHVENIQKFYYQLVEEYDSVLEYNELTTIDSSPGYIDSRQKNQIIEKRNALKNKITAHEKLFYVWSNNSVVINAIKKHNELFIATNKSNPIFDSINERSLDSEQRESVLTDESSTLVVAGAGSGKTLTICGKVEYLLKVQKVNPSDILLLSYSKKSAEDLQNKVSKINSRLTVGTFHKIGLEVLKETQNKTFMVEDQYKAIIEAYFREEMRKRPHMLQTILTYYGLYLTSDKHDKKYKNEGEMYEDLRKSDFSTLRTQLLSLTNDINKRETIKKELVKSFEEMAIANWYFINGIDYIYEAPYEKDVSTADKRQYMPDFRLPKYKIYHEHYGINKQGRADQFEGQEAAMYVANMQWKRAIHQQNNTICIETYSYEFDDGTVFDKLEKELKSRGVVFKPLEDDQIFNALESIYEGQAFKSFINLIRTFLSLYKAVYRSVDGFEELKKYEFANRYERKRADFFLDIVKDVYLYYMEYLRREDKIDFDDMILQSTIDLDKTDKFKFKYIIVDEFQDISVSRMKFLKKLISHGGSKLFAVGDDWQAIYRFSGCDLNIFLKFPDYFGESAITKITTTHRNSQELQDIAGPFIKANPEQFDKKINSARHLEHPVQIMYYSEKKYYAFLDVLKEIAKINKEAKVLILGRNNKDFEDIALDTRVYIDFRESNETRTVVKVRDYPKMQLSYSTVHGSKGLEEDYVIIINADDSRLGFPNKMEDDELLDMVLSSKSGYEYAEERRLWYVALTRTRNYTYIIANNENPSLFVKEIENQCLVMNPNMEVNHEGEISCPRCKSGRLVLRANESDGSKFYGCSNYPYCNYSINDFRAVRRNKRCPHCGDIMVFKKGPYGAFYGCHNYPRCKHKEEYDGK